MIVELYGFQFHNTKEKITQDAGRERYFQGLGYQIIRFTGTEVYKDVQKCVREMLALAKIQPASAPVNPSRPTVVQTPGAPLAKQQAPARTRKKYFSMTPRQLVVIGLLIVILVISVLWVSSMMLK